MVAGERAIYATTSGIHFFKMAYGLGPQGRTPLLLQQYFRIKNLKHGFNGTFLLYMRYERAAWTEYSASVRLQPDISVTMQLHGKWAQRNHIRVKCRATEPSPSCYVREHVLYHMQFGVAKHKSLSHDSSVSSTALRGSPFLMELCSSMTSEVKIAKELTAAWPSGPQLFFAILASRVVEEN